MSCEEFWLVFADLLRDLLPESRREEAVTHLEGCSRCRKLLEDEHIAEAAVRHLEAEPYSLEELGEARRIVDLTLRPRRARPGPWLIALACAAAVLLWVALVRHPAGVRDGPRPLAETPAAETPPAAFAPSSVVAPFPTRPQLEEYARRLDSEGCRYASSLAMESDRTVFVQYRTSSRTGAQYACARRILGSGLFDAFPEVRCVSICVADARGPSLTFTVRRSVFASLAPADLDLPWTKLSTRFRVLFDRGATGRTTE